MCKQFYCGYKIIKHHYSLILAVILSLTPAQVSTVHAVKTKEIQEAYVNSDYVKVVELLEQKIDQFREKQQSDYRRKSLDLYSDYLLLAYIYAWKLSEPEKALKFYQESIKLRQSPQARRRMPAFEFLHMADVYEWKKDFSRAEEYYRKFMGELIALKAKEHDDFSIIMANELIRFTKYQIDSINLKNGKDLLLPELKLSSIMFHNITPFFMTFFFSPAAKFETDIAMKTGLSDYFKMSPKNVCSMFFNFSLLLSSAGGSVDESSERAMEVYLLKYPESYGALLLRYLFYKYYKESDQKQKAEALFVELEGIGRKRGMTFIVSPDKRFSSSERTWETYKKALIDGDIDTALECHVPGNNKYQEIFQIMGQEKLKEMAEKMRPIEKITSDQMSAKYRINRKMQGKDITFYIYFTNINGEWKIMEY